MKKAILARKIGMTQVFSEKGELVCVTVLEAGPCVIVQKKTVENDGYNAIQVGFGTAKARLTNKPKTGHFAKANTEIRKVLKELRLEECSGYEIGAEIKADVFTAGDKVDVTGISKGKGYAGTIKRHNMACGPMSHGSKYHRGTGSLSSATTPGKVKKGKKMSGHMGNVQVTVQNLTIVRADAEKNLILVKGAVPGPRGTLIQIKNAIKGK